MHYPKTDFSSYCVMSIWFECNNRCTICMLSEVRHPVAGLSYERFKEETAIVVQEGRYRNLILSGGEVTTFPDLGRYVSFASSLGWFEKIQIQTNGKRLADERYVEHLIDCGVNEFFVSVQGLEETNDAITRVPGSFRQTIKGIGNLAGNDVRVITNTVLTTQTLPEMPALVDFLLAQPVHEVQIWNFFPMERTDSRNRVVSLKDFNALLPRLAAAAAQAQKPVVLKSFPECLSAPPPLTFDSTFPATVLPDLFWKQFGECGFGQCVHRKAGTCTSKVCWGLSSAYIKKYGDEREFLKPIGRG